MHLHCVTSDCRTVNQGGSSPGPSGKIGWLGGQHGFALPSIDCLPCCNCALMCTFPCFWLREVGCINWMHWWCSWYPWAVWVAGLVVGKGKAGWWIFGTGSSAPAVVGPNRQQAGVGDMPRGRSKVGDMPKASLLWAGPCTRHTHYTRGKGAEVLQCELKTVDILSYFPGT